MVPHQGSIGILSIRQTGEGVEDCLFASPIDFEDNPAPIGTAGFAKIAPVAGGGVSIPLLVEDELRSRCPVAWICSVGAARKCVKDAEGWRFWHPRILRVCPRCRERNL